MSEHKLTKNEFFERYVIKGPFPYLWLGILILFIYIAVFPLTGNNDIKSIQINMAILVTISAAAGLTSYYYGKLTFKQAVMLFFIIGFVMRMGYALYTPYNVRQHDIGPINGNGHLGYIYYIFQNNALPNNNSFEFYHPPLAHILGAVWLKINTYFSVPSAMALSGLKMLSVFYTSAMMIVVFRIFRLLPLSKSAVLIATGLFCVHPIFYILSANINNDTLMILLFSGALLYSIKWYKNPSFKNILILAALIGLCMMTKLSGALIAPVTATVFIMKLIEMKKQKKMLIPQFAAFAAVSFPLGLWYPLRNYLLFKQPLSYVFKFSTSDPVYCGDRNLFDRLINIPWPKIFNQIFCSPSDDYNIPLYFFKSSIFGEFNYWNANIQAILLIYSGILLVLISLAAMIFIYVKDRRKNTAFLRYVFTVNFLVQIISYLHFNITYPYACTMDFRYVIPILFSAISFAALAYDLINKTESRFTYVFTLTFYVIFALFSFTSVYLYISLT